MHIVLDTSVFVSALLGKAGASREVVRRCLRGEHSPWMSLALFAEYRDVLGRDSLFASCALDAGERTELFQALMSVCQFTEIYYLWRPNLVDEGDNHVLELAVAAGAEAIVTHNRADFERSELLFPNVRILAPAELLKEEH